MGQSDVLSGLREQFCQRQGPVKTVARAIGKNTACPA